MTAEPTDDEAALIERASRGDAEALHLLIERHLPGLRAFIRMRAGPLVRKRESETDLSQSICREVLEQMDRFQHANANAFKRWLYTTALRKLVNRHDYYTAEKRDARREALAGDLLPGAADLGDHYKSFTTPSQHAMKREEIEKIERAFDHLSEEEREIISLAHVLGMTRGEIAEHLGKSEGAVRTQLSRALSHLAELVRV